MITKKKKLIFEDYLLERVKDSGYPLEIEISNLLDIRKEYVVMNTQYYYDIETSKGRDIDIYAFYLKSLLSEKVESFSLRTELAIECKKSESHVWVFYTRPRFPMSRMYISGQYRTSVPKLEEHSSESFQELLEGECLDFLYTKFERHAIAYDEIKKKKGSSSRREIFEAINQLVKFTCY